MNSASCLPCRLTQPGTREPRRRSQYPPPKPHQSGRRQPSAQALPALVDLLGQSPRRALASCSTEIPLGPRRGSPRPRPMRARTWRNGTGGTAAATSGLLAYRDTTRRPPTTRVRPSPPQRQKQTERRRRDRDRCPTPDMGRGPAARSRRSRNRRPGTVCAALRRAQVRRAPPPRSWTNSNVCSRSNGACRAPARWHT